MNNLANATLRHFEDLTQCELEIFTDGQIQIMIDDLTKKLRERKEENYRRCLNEVLKAIKKMCDCGFGEKEAYDDGNDAWLWNEMEYLLIQTAEKYIEI